jgi:transcriptional regulator with XRE-family HTH domain
MKRELKIGTLIRNLRINQNRTIQEISDRCGLSKSMISKIETNSVFPSVATLIKLAEALGTNVSSLLEKKKDDCGSSLVTRKRSLEGTVLTERGYNIFPYASEFHGKKMQPFLFIAKKGEVKEHHLTHNGEEFIYVLEGSMRFQVGDIEYKLSEGDALYFNALEKHQIIPESEIVKYIDIFA